MLTFEQLKDVFEKLQALNSSVLSRAPTRGLCAQVAYGYLARMQRTLHAVELLLPHGHASAIMALMRPVAEAAVRVRWMGDDQQNAQLLVDDSVLQKQLMAEQWLTHGFTLPEHVAAVRSAGAKVLKDRGLKGRKDFEKLLKRPEAMEREIWGSTEIYDLFFREASAHVHATVDSASQALRPDTPEQCRRAIHLTLAAASLLLRAALPLLGVEESLLASCNDLTAGLGVDWEPRNASRPSEGGRS